MTQPLQIQPDHVQVVINALAARPWGEVNHVMVSLMGQMQQQQAPQQEPAAPPAKAEKAERA